MRKTVCRLKGINKSFGTNNVLRRIDLDLIAGEIIVLMGANGAGKSTLVKLICGYHRLDSGSMELNGKDYRPMDPAAAIASGIVTVHQSIDDGVVPDLDIATNLMLDHLTRPDASLWTRDRQLRQQAARVAQSMGITTDVRTRVADLGVADRQMIAIARAMARSPDVLILDEPTSSLSATEADRLFTLLDSLRAKGVAILYISHRMSDIRRVADRIVCMRDGAISGVFDQQPLDYDSAVTSMLGHAMTDVDISPVTGIKPVLNIRGLKLGKHSAPINLVAHDGEVIAMTGLLGSGKSALAEILFGLRPAHGGNMFIDGEPYAPANASDAVNSGVHMSPKDRSLNAVIPTFNITDNICLPFLRSFCQLGLLRGYRQRQTADRMISQMGVVCQSAKDGINTLSGGNQQKVMIGRWLVEPCRLLLLDEPFQGVDIGARRDIGRHIRASANGRATIVFVAEIDEALEIADRIVVLHESQIVGEHINNDINLNTLIAQVSGAMNSASMSAAS
ncbi:sugar ABC transporter ATP-binding protein [Granulosicoccus sp. 3-233]|uniref:sugar ABC transporter ATP-binding protein n=1 Tax=Granulosicoccus sp. 3-233 TaxID=3417969 RepID=UPI003D355C0A